MLLLTYAFFLGFILVYSLVQLDLAIKYRKEKRKTPPKVPSLPKDLPYITVQLPLYNELYVVERLLDRVAELDWPSDKLEIQVLDDSTDESFALAAAKVAELQAAGLNIAHIKRPDRKGFKAGALAYGLQRSKGELVAIFDADFLPYANTLKSLVPYFSDPEIGMVQAKWEHLNEGHSLMTRLQAFALEAHFTVEQTGRNSAGHFMNFNGTAGMWRRECIGDAGGWSSDTLTEDLDLSYRAQLKGWKFKYLEQLGAPAELPAAMDALKTQQYRWTKGAAECAVKNLSKVLRSQSLNSKTKLHAVFHLLNSFVFICVFTTAILSLPIILVQDNYPDHEILFQVNMVFGVSMVFLAFFYWVSMLGPRKGTWKEFFRFLIRYPLFLAISMGLSLHNAIAVVEGYMGRKTPFVRTPKFNMRQSNDKIAGNKYLQRAIGPLTIIELILVFYFAGSLILALSLREYAFVPFLILLCFGFAYVGLSSLLQLRHAQSA